MHLSCSRVRAPARFRTLTFERLFAFLLYRIQWTVEHTLFSAFKRFLRPSAELLDGGVVPIADLPDLYRVFERC